MNTVHKSSALSSTFWIMACIVLACLIYLLLFVSKQSASRETKNTVLTKPAILEPRPLKRLNPEDEFKGKAPKSEQLPTPPQLEKYKPNER